LPPEFKKNLIPVLEGVHLIVIGYGGYDTGIMDYLRETTSRKPIYWCCRDKSRLSAETKKLLTEQDFIVEIKGFDRFMLMLNAKLKHDLNASNSSSSISCFLPNSSSFSWYFFACLTTFLTNTLSLTLST
jgi:hypothetical protein